MKARNIFLLMIMSVVALAVNAQTWTQINSNTTNFLNSCNFADQSTVYVTGISKTLLRSTDGGLTFSPVNMSFLPSNRDLSGCFFSSADTGYITGGDYSSFPTDGFIYKTVNAGSSWTNVLTGLGSATNAITFPGDRYGYVIGGEANSGIIYKSTDFGMNWTSIYNSGITANMLLSAFFLDKSKGYVAGNDEGSFQAKLITITNGSVSSNTNFPAWTAFTDIYFRSVDTGFATAFNGATGYILKTVNGGLAFSTVYTGVSLNSLTFVNKTTGYAVGYSGTILRTVNGGDTWSTMTSPVTSQLKSVEFANPNLGIIVGDNGVILRLAIITGIDAVPDEKQGVTVFPNPCTDKIYFENADRVRTIEFYDHLGKLVMKAGQEKISGNSIDISELGAGMYIMKIIDEKSIFHLKVVKQ